MNCDLFERRVSEYLDHELAADAERECAEHLMRCVECRTLLREVEETVKTLRESATPEVSPALHSRVLAIPALSSGISCAEFEDCITDFLDGFVTAPSYHDFQDHAQSCATCSDTLTETVLAVGACHSVHFEDSADAPEHLIQRILEKTSVARARRRARWGFWERWLNAAREFFRPVLTPQWAAGMAIVGASMMVLVFTVSDDGSMAGVLRQTNNYASRTLTRGETLVTKKDLVLDGLKSLTGRIAALWDKPGSGTTEQPKPNDSAAPAGDKTGIEGQDKTKSADEGTRHESGGQTKSEKQAEGNK